ncbi:MAG: F0F1 ATP synthase subunit A [Candidatus Brocadiae bacterium]|nr:F0F1 ATP synthase subunit A [Candidatus Brocadiia bacterium]
MSPSEMPLAVSGPIALPTSILMTWGAMGVLVVLSLVVRSRLAARGVGKLQSFFELFMEALCSLIREIVRTEPGPYVPLIGTLFLFVLVANLFGMVPGLRSPTEDLSVTAALAAVVFVAVPVYGVRARGWRNYFKGYVRPNPFLLPLNILSELTRTLALGVRLFGNIMSGQFLLVVVIGVVTTVLRGYARVFMLPAFALTLFLSVLSLITAVIQAYIFTVLALVYIGAGIERRVAKQESTARQQQEAES